MAAKKGLGKGLDSLIKPSAEIIENEKLDFYKISNSIFSNF